MAVNLNGPHTVALALSWVVLFLLALVAFTTPGKKTIQRWVVSQTKMRATKRIAVAVLTVLLALIAFFPLGGYRMLPTKWENCFVQGGIGQRWRHALREALRGATRRGGRA